jgi:nucleotide-binding universal stress UspA family protein/CheY-like chemotaxis protein
MATRILVPVDGSPHSDKAIEFAADMTKQKHCVLHLLHVVAVSKIPRGVEEYIKSEGLKENPETAYLQFAGSQILVAAEEEARRHGLSYMEKALLKGDPAQQIIQYASDHDVDVIIMGRRGLGSDKGPMLGSAASKTVQGCDRTCLLVKKGFLEGKKILVVDDEPDVLETLEELLDMCEVVKASTFQEAKEQIETQHFDLAVLDIMGVDGFNLLKLSKEKNIKAVILTGHSLSPESTFQSYKEGAAFYVPKDEIARISTFLNDVLEAEERGKNSWWRWLERLGSYYSDHFGPQWRSRE